MRRIIGGVVVLVGLLSSGCASIVSDSSYPVTISSSPEGVNYTVKHAKRGYAMMKGVTPATISLSADDGFFSKASYLVSFEKRGYDAVTIQLRAGMDGWYVGNILFGGLIGFLIIDPATGAMWKLDEQVQVALTESRKEDAGETVEFREKEPEQPETAAGKDSDELTLLMINDVPEAYRNSLVRVN
ncbi:hypothetical protein [Alcanivorax sp. DP30]|uniref:hypothetical protein n=1 Tax=Alcanivorax sp. DP30 TaxID=2606217 RepID=UPI0013713DD5|nr:hypothetical protein [Alcanivorax sp. DP30]MZR64335.1 hypothetical protein [Alcanivorax sp. DP30]